MNDAIGPHQFIGLHGHCDPPKQQIAPPMVRPGIDGVGLRRTGIRGRPSRLRSVVDAGNLADARAKYKAYRELIGATPVQLVQHDCDYQVEGWQVAVLDVRRVRMQKAMTPCGGLNPPSLAKLICEWDVIAVAVV